MGFVFEVLSFTGLWNVVLMLFSCLLNMKSCFNSCETTAVDRLMDLIWKKSNRKSSFVLLGCLYSVKT